MNNPNQTYSTIVLLGSDNALPLIIPMRGEEWIPLICKRLCIWALSK